MTDILEYIVDNYIIDNEYQLDDTLDWWEQTKLYILRYRRIIGCIMLIILIGIMYYCNLTISVTKEIIQDGGAGQEMRWDKFRFNSGSSTPATPATPAAAPEQKSKKSVREKLTSAKNSAKSYVKQRPGEIAKKVSTSYTGKKLGKLGSEATAKLGESKVGKAISGKASEYQKMREAGMSRTKIAGKFTGQLGSYALGQFKEFSTWLYEILFAIAISICICMIVVPSISFIILGIICYILLKKKMSSMKGI